MDGIVTQIDGTQLCFPYSTSQSKNLSIYITFVMARRICKIPVNNSVKNKHLKQLKENFGTYGHPEKIVEIGILKALKISQPTQLRNLKQLKKKSKQKFNVYL